MMYHSVLPSEASTYVISPDKIRRDIRWLKAHGYTSVRLRDVEDFALGLGTLPEKPVVFTFDDGQYNVLKYVLPIFAEEGAYGVMSVVGCFSDETVRTNDCNKPKYSSLTWEQMRELSASKLFEIGNHTWALHNINKRYGILQRHGEPAEQYVKTVSQDILKLQNKLTEIGVATSIFAYPFGKFNGLAQRTLASLGFTVILTCTEEFNTVTVGNTDTLLKLGRYNRSGAVTTEEFFRRIGA